MNKIQEPDNKPKTLADTMAERLEQALPGLNLFVQEVNRLVAQAKQLLQPMVERFNTYYVPLLKQIIEDWQSEQLAEIEKEWQRSQNPLMAWLAYQHCRNLKKPIPDWVLNYFDTLAASLFEVLGENHEDAKKRQHAILKAFGFAGDTKGVADFVRKIAKEEERFQIYLTVFLVKEQHQLSLEKTIGRIMKGDFDSRSRLKGLYLSEEKLRRAYIWGNKKYGLKDASDVVKQAIVRPKLIKKKKNRLVQK